MDWTNVSVPDVMAAIQKVRGKGCGAAQHSSQACCPRSRRCTKLLKLLDGNSFVLSRCEHAGMPACRRRTSIPQDHGASSSTSFRCPRTPTELSRASNATYTITGALHLDTTCTALLQSNLIAQHCELMILCAIGSHQCAHTCPCMPSLNQHGTLA